MSSIQRILHPTDFSEIAASAQVRAQELAAQLGAELHVLHVTSPPSSAITAELDSSLSSSSSQVRQLRARLQRTLPGGAEAVLAVRTGPAADTIVAYADDIAADLIVIGTRALTGLRLLVLGSVTEAVLRTAGCPVMVVRLGPR